MITVKKKKIVITDRHWEAIQAGAVSHNILINILRNADLKELKQRAMPRYKSGLSTARTARAKSMLAEGHTLGEVADALGVSVNTIKDIG